MAKNRPDLPPLAQYKDIAEYVPRYGDTLVWSGWFSTWFGVVAEFDENTGELSVIFAGIPFLLFTMKEDEMKKETRKIALEKIQGSSHGTFAVHQHDYTRNISLWFI
jgi:hypothetical protein